MSRHHRESSDAEQYGRHSQANARGSSVRVLLQRVVAQGEAIRLAWRGDENTSDVDRSDEFPTAVLPTIRDDDSNGAKADEDTEPTTATREARRWLRPPGFSWWQQLLAG